MASFNGFIRKAPAQRLEQFCSARGLSVPDGFDWISEGRGTELVKSINALISDLPELKQDQIKAELGLLATLSDDVGTTATEQVCSGRGVEIEGMEGAEDVLLFIAIEHSDLLNKIEAQASMSRWNGGRNWSTFQFKDDGKPWALDSEGARRQFLQDTLAILELPKHRNHLADWYETVRIEPFGGGETNLINATIYIEERAASELSFDDKASLERKTVAKVLEVGVSCDTKSRIVEICTKRGGKKIRDMFSTAFARNFAPLSDPPVEVPRRQVLLHRLKREPDFEVRPSDGIERIEVSSLDFGYAGQGIARFERRGQGETIYQFLERRFGSLSPLTSGGWTIIAATLRIVLAAREGKRSRTLTVTLRLPNTTTLPNKTEKDRQFTFALLERWGLLAPPPDPFEVVEDD
ncbi:MAG: hypothetical protein AAFO17_12240 [Pseudomonadota bacterium]